MSQDITRAVRAGIGEDPRFGAVAPPLYLSANYTFAGLGEKRAYDYTRTANPTRDLLGEALAELEGGAGGVVTASGMAAVHLATQLVDPAGRVLLPHDCYGGTFRLMTSLAKRGHFQVDVVNYHDAASFSAALDKRPTLVWIETPSNPLLRITDIAAVVHAAHLIGAKVVVDNTFLSPALQKPLAFGADLVVHSTTKYINGHSDVVGGAVIAADAALHTELAWWANCLGLTGSPFDSYLTLRGLRTLHARMTMHEANAQAIARMLADHPAVKAVHYPGLSAHPGHAIAQRQQQGSGGMLSFALHGGHAEVRAFIDGLQCFSLAESLGGVESLIAHPATMTHAAMTPEARARAGIDETLLRLSVGIEATADLLRDMQAGLERASRGLRAPPRRHHDRLGGDVTSQDHPV